MTKGNGADMLKAGSKRRRTKAQILEEKRAKVCFPSFLRFLPFCSVFCFVLFCPLLLLLFLLPLQIMMQLPLPRLFLLMLDSRSAPRAIERFGSAHRRVYASAAAFGAGASVTAGVPPASAGGACGMYRTVVRVVPPDDGWPWGMP